MSIDLTASLQSVSPLQEISWKRFGSEINVSKVIIKQIELVPVHICICKCGVNI